MNKNENLSQLRICIDMLDLPSHEKRGFNTDDENNCVHFYNPDKRQKIWVTRTTKTPKKNYSPYFEVIKIRG